MQYGNGDFLLMGRDEHEGLCSFPSGFVDPGETDLSAAMRALEEEVSGITVDTLKQVGTCPIEDPRYRGTSDGVTTSFFCCRHLTGIARVNDGAKSVMRVKRSELINRLVPWQRPLGELALSVR